MQKREEKLMQYFIASEAEQFAKSYHCPISLLYQERCWKFNIYRLRIFLIWFEKCEQKNILPDEEEDH